MAHAHSVDVEVLKNLLKDGTIRIITAKYSREFAHLSTEVLEHRRTILAHRITRLAFLKPQAQLETNVELSVINETIGYRQQAS